MQNDLDPGGGTLIQNIDLINLRTTATTSSSTSLSTSLSTLPPSLDKVLVQKVVNYIQLERILDKELESIIKVE